MKSSSVGSKAPACAGTKKVEADPQAALRPGKEEAAMRQTRVKHTCLKAACARWKENRCSLAGMLHEMENQGKQ